MPYKHIRIYGKRYIITPSLENMCSLEEETQTNLIQGVNAKDINLCFMRSTIENILEDDSGQHISPDVLDKIYSEDVEFAQKIFTSCYREMYHFPNIPAKRTSAIKKLIALPRIYARLRRDGL